MKKAKIMLSVIVVLGVVGGALAFKAKNYGQATFCYGTALHTTCNLNAVFSTVIAGNAVTYTQVDNINKCTGTELCPFHGILQAN